MTPDVAAHSVQLLTDAQLAILMGVLSAGITAAGVAFRWAVNRLVRALDDSTKARLDGATSSALLVAKVDEVHEHWIGRERAQVHGRGATVTAR